MYLSCCFIQTAWVDTPLPLSTTYGLTHPSEIRGFHLTRASSWSSQNLSNVNNPGSIDAVHVDWVMQVEQVEKKWEPTWMKPVGKLLIQGCRYPTMQHPKVQCFREIHGFPIFQTVENPQRFNRVYVSTVMAIYQL